MSQKEVRIHNKSDKPDNILMKENEIFDKCLEIQDELPSFMKGFFTYLKGSILPMSRLAYLRDIRFFCQYLIQETDLTEAREIKDIKLAEFDNSELLGE